MSDAFSSRTSRVRNSGMAHAQAGEDELAGREAQEVRYWRSTPSSWRQGEPRPLARAALPCPAG
ncbi:MAG: hypothetical protein IPF85_06215 [Anaerolineae bacterium]|nr:hypothetical protein [Anaerolineae bacterium]